MFGLFNFRNNFSEYDIMFAIYPFFELCKIFGLCPFSIKKQQGTFVGFKRTYLAIFYSVIVLAAVTYGFVMTILSFKVTFASPSKASEFSIVAAWVQVYSLFFVAAFGLISSWPKIQDQIAVLEKFRFIDQQLKQLNKVESYKNTRALLFLQTIILSFLPIIFSMVNCALISTKNVSPLSLCYWFICFAPILIITLKEFKYYNLIILVQHKFNVVNEILVSMVQQNTDSNNIIFVQDLQTTPILCQPKVTRKFQPFLDENKMNETIKKLSCIYSELRNIVSILQNIFAVHLLLMISIAFIIITIQVYYIFAIFMKSIQLTTFRVIAVVVWTFIEAFSVILNVCVCSKTIRAMSDTGPLLHNIQSLSDSTYLFRTAQMFSLQILHRNVNFTAAGFFNLDYKLITSIVAAVTTYLVIIIQFHISNNSDNIIAYNYTNTSHY